MENNGALKPVWTSQREDCRYEFDQVHRTISEIGVSMKTLTAEMSSAMRLFGNAIKALSAAVVIILITQSTLICLMLLKDSNTNLHASADGIHIEQPR